MVCLTVVLILHLFLGYPCLNYYLISPLVLPCSGDWEDWDSS